jgi:hypothetical protein
VVGEHPRSGLASSSWLTTTVAVEVVAVQRNYHLKGRQPSSTVVWGRKKIERRSHFKGGCQKRHLSTFYLLISEKINKITIMVF